MAIPARIMVGDHVSFSTKLKNYAPADGWSLRYHLVNADSAERVDGVADGDSWQFTIAGDDTADFSPGVYSAFAVVEKDGERITVIQQRVLVQPDPTEGAGDFRSVAEITLEAIEAVLARKATHDQKTITVDGQMLTRYSFDELFKVRDRYRAEVQREREREANNGRVKRRVMRTRMK